jgi:hypothetical protein
VSSLGRSTDQTRPGPGPEETVRAAPKETPKRIGTERDTYDAHTPGDLGIRAEDPTAPPEVSGIEQHRQFLSAVFDGQPKDAQWSRDAEFELSQSLLPLLENENSSATRIDCRTDLCHFEISNKSDEAYDLTFQTILHQRVWNAGMLVARSPSAPNTLIVYLAKKGKLVPSPT